MTSLSSLSEIFRSADLGWRGHNVPRLFAPLVLCIWIVAACVSVRADDAREDGRIHVDIPAQPLATALDAYCAAADIQMFIDTESIAGRRSVAIRGEYTRRAALESLLSGTDLAPRFVGDRGFTLVSVASADAGPSRPSGFASQRFGGYSAVLQTSLRKALCRSEETRPGTYRFLGRLWIGALGKISRAELITSTGDSMRDAALLSALQDATVGEAPPPDLPQPVTLLLAADPIVAAEYCAGIGPGVQPVNAVTEVRR
jgi:Secretin and TonB N terminus short domain